MKVLNEKETELIKLAVQEGLIETQSKLWIDFKVGNDSLTVHQDYRLSQITELLYTLFCEVVEQDGVLQSKYEQ
jgi:hypothetical protein